MSTLFDDTAAPVVDPNKDYLPELVGEGKKYKDPSALAYAAVHKDAHISQLEKETKELREELVKRATLEEVMTRISQNKPVENKQVITPAEASQPESLTKEQLESLIAEQIARTRSEDTAKSNFDKVKDALQKAWGSDYQSKLDAKAKELGLGRDWMNQIAGSQPKAFLTLVGVDAKVAPGAVSPFDVSAAGVNTAALQNNSHRGERKKSYYDAMKNTDRNKYLSKEVQKEMYDQAMKLGIDYFDA
jgi:hypothetical protein